MLRRPPRSTRTDTPFPTRRSSDLAENEGVTLTWSTQWIGKATDFNAQPGDIGYRTSDVFYHNAQVAFQFLENSRFYVGVDNLFDKIGRASCRERVCQYV